MFGSHEGDVDLVRGERFGLASGFVDGSLVDRGVGDEQDVDVVRARSAGAKGTCGPGSEDPRLVQPGQVRKGVAQQGEQAADVGGR